MNHLATRIRTVVRSRLAQSLAVVLMGLASLPSQAALVNGTGSFNTTSYGFTTDTSSGLDWLDIPYSGSDTYSNMQTLVNTSGFFGGWRHATLADLMGFMGNFIDPSKISYSTVGVGTIYSAAGYPKVETALSGVPVDVFGYTGSHSSGNVLNNATFAGGIVADTVDGKNISFTIGRMAGLFQTANDYVSYAMVAPNVSTRHWLVRDNPDFPAVSPVPAPAAVWLFGSGLLALIGVVRRRTASPLAS